MKHYQKKKDFYSHLNMEDITYADYMHTRSFKKTNLGKYYDLYSQSDILLVADVFENFRNRCLEIYQLSSACFLTAPGLS